MVVMKTKAKIFLNKLLESIYFGSRQKENFKNYGKQINRANWDSAHAMYVFSACLTFCLCVFSIINIQLKDYFVPYLGLFLVSCIMLVSNIVYIKKYQKSSGFLYYVWIIFFAGFITYAGAVVAKDLCPLLISVILLTAPLFIIDKPFKLSISNIMVTVIFLTLAYFDRPFEEAKINVINLTLITLLSVCLIYYFTKAKLSNIANKEKLRKQRDTDYLTQLSTRGAGEKAVTFHLNNDKNLSVMLVMDLDNFKGINDNYGHRVGDEVLLKTAVFVKNFFKEKNYTTRLGGDEFSIFVPNIVSKEWVFKKCDELVALIKNSVLVEDKQVLTCSVGVAFSEDTLKTYDDMYRCADVALYQAKNKGKNTFSVYTKNE